MAEDVFTPTEGQQEVSAIEALVGEGKKFQTMEDLAKGKLAGDTHVAQLEGELKVLREAMAEKEEPKKDDATVADLLKAIRESQANTGTEGNDNQVSDKDLSETVREVLRGETEAQTKARNREVGNEAVLQKVNGDVEAAKTYVAERAKQVGMTPTALGELSEVSPKAFIKLLDADKSTGSPGISTIAGKATAIVDNANTVTQIDGHHTKAYYDNLKKEMGVGKYWQNVKIQGQYTKDAMALGDRFKN